MSKILKNLSGSPLLLTLIIGLLLFSILLIRGLDFGPLQTDIIIQRAWFQEVGVAGFPAKMLEVNQRHILYGWVYAWLYSLFGEQNAPWTIILIFSRIFQGAFLAGIICQLTKRRTLAICAGFALTLTIIRVPELYQMVNWFIEPTLALLLASSYTYMRSVQSQRRRWLWAVLSVALYVVSILIYESGIPWVGVNLLLGWLLRPDQPFRRRTWSTIRDSLPTLISGAFVTFLVVFGFTPWQGLAPDTNAGSLSRILSLFATTFQLPAQIVSALQEALHNGYAALLLICAILAGIGAAVIVLLSARSRDTEAEQLWTPTKALELLVLAAVMIAAGVLIGTSNSIGQEYLDRITFGRSAGIMLFYVVLIFLIGELLLKRWGTLVAAVVTAVVLLGPGFARLWMYQDVAQRSWAEIDRLVPAVIEVRKTIYLPAHLMILTDPDWVVSRFTDASDVILHDTQERLYKANEPATIDFIKTGMYAENYLTLPGTCILANQQQSGGMCLGRDRLHLSRWAAQSDRPYADVVVLHWNDTTGKLELLRGVKVDALQQQGYNISTAGPNELNTNPDRVAVPLP